MYPYAWVVNLTIGWLVTVALAFVGYLIALQIKEIRRNRSMDDQRERLGLRRVCGSLTSWLF
jgi:ABC-type cobalamin transport system permease subunit